MNDSHKKSLMSFKDSGFQCSQVVVATLTEQLGIEPKQALRLASGFGGGIAGQGDICGALSGAIMAIGLKHGYNKGPDVNARNKVYFLTRELIQRIKAKHGCYTCKGLTGIDFTNLEEGMKLFYEQGIADKICKHVAIDTIEIVEEIW